MEWLNAIVQGVLLGGLFALFATGLSLIFGVMRLVNLAHGDLIILGAFLAIAVVEALSRSAGHTWPTGMPCTPMAIKSDADAPIPAASVGVNSPP